MTPNARVLARDILRQARAHQGFASELIDAQLQTTPLTAVERRLLTQLLLGTLRRQGSLDALLRPLIRRPLARVEPDVLDLLRLGAFQLLFLSHIPAHAAVNESVKLAAAIRPGAKGFVNGVLRRVAQLRTDEQTSSPAADALPLEKGIFRKLAQPLLPDPQQHPRAYLEQAFSQPRWLAERWLSRFGPQECFRLGFWFLDVPTLWVRVNRLKTDRDALLRRWQQAGIAAELGTHPQALRLAETHSVRDLPGYAEGWFVVQDESAMQVATLLAPPPGSRILDLCAAPGGKTTHLAELMDDTGEVLACDIDLHRLATVEQLAQRLGLRSIRTQLLEPNQSPPAGPFDAVLLDVPCSNTGVLGRRPEVRWRLQPKELPHLVKRQWQLLEVAIERVRPGGRIVYSTCSIEPEENQMLIDAFVRAHPEWQCQAAIEAIPGQPADGGFRALLQRSH